jgi:hypothetical protein
MNSRRVHHIIDYRLQLCPPFFMVLHTEGVSIYIQVCMIIDYRLQLCMCVRCNYISATQTPLWCHLHWVIAFLIRYNNKMDVIYLHCTFILCRHWKDVSIGDYLIKRGSLLGLLDGGLHVLLPL